ncbi:MAG TPA: hypothetical protein VHT05_11685 [Candidatus Elarobacter sp.]|nr:hypothetical protein [Candidatus Elarobacter sp.]
MIARRFGSVAAAALMLVALGAEPRRAAGPEHLQNWKFFCQPHHRCVRERNEMVDVAWMGRHVDWNEVNALREASDVSRQLHAAGVKHVIVYTDPDLAPYCGTFPVPGGRFINSFLLPAGVREDGTNPCSTSTEDESAAHIHAIRGSYAHAFQHQSSNGDRLYVLAYPDDAKTKYEPFNIGDKDVQNAFTEVTRENAGATDVLQDDGGGDYNCEPSYGYCGHDAGYGRPSSGSPSCAHVDHAEWCYLFGATAVEWDRRGSPSNPRGAQQAFLDDAVTLTDASTQPVIANNGGAADAYSMQWVRRATRLEGIMLENVWGDISEPHWVNNANAALLYHALHKYVIEYFGGDGASPNVLTQLASHWIVYDPVYSVEAIIYNFPSGDGIEDGTFPEETVVPSVPLVAAPASNDVGAFRIAPHLYAREFAVCYDGGAPLGGCAAIVNTGAGAAPLPNLMRPYRRVLVQNTRTSWFRGGRPQWSNAVPREVAGGTGIILAQ